MLLPTAPETKGRTMQQVNGSARPEVSPAGHCPSARTFPSAPSNSSSRKALKDGAVVHSRATTRMSQTGNELSPAATGGPGLRPRPKAAADLAARLYRVQQRQQARFAALPPSMKEDFHILVWHQHRLRANQAAHDAALARLQGTTVPQN